jgi:hypothetical protein
MVIRRWAGRRKDLPVHVAVKVRGADVDGELLRSRAEPLAPPPQISPGAHVK